jgi:hypothetical protein
MRVGVCCAGIGALVLCTGTGWGQPKREGFTGDLGLGASLTTIAKDDDPPPPSFGGSPPPIPAQSTETRESKLGLAPLSLSLGGYFSPTVALLFRASGTSYFQNSDQYVNNFYGPVVEIWPHDRFYLSAGVGLGVFGPNPLVSRSSRDPLVGLAFDARAGVALINGKNHDLTLSIEVIPGFYKNDESVQGYALVAAWKWY